MSEHTDNYGFEAELTTEPTREPRHRAEPDGAPQTREEVTAGYVNPSQARLDAWAKKIELTR